MVQRASLAVLTVLLVLSSASIQYKPTSGLSVQLWLVGGVFAVEPQEVMFADSFEALPVTLDSPANGESVCSADVVLTGHVDNDVVQLLINGVETPLSSLQFTSAAIMLTEGANDVTLEAVLAGGGSKLQLASINRVPFTREVNTDLLDITIPSAGISSVAGFANAANAGASVTVSNSRTGTSQVVSADGSGGFSTNVGTQEGDTLTFVSDLQNICPPSGQVSSLVPGTNHAPILAAIGAKVVDLGQTLSFTTLASDSDNDLLEFSAIQLPSNASLDAMSGEFSYHPDETQAGTVDVVFSVSDGGADDNETVSITVNPAANDGITMMSGRVIDTTDFVNDGTETPVTGATVSIINSGISAVTAADGSFTLSPIPAGEQLFDIDTTGTTAPDGSDYAGFREAIHIIDKVNNQHDRAFFLPRIAMDSLTIVNPNSTTVVENSALGVRISIPPHTAKWIDGSDYDGPVSISEVPDAVAPAALPPNLGFGLLVTIQPVGLYFVKPIPIWFPNGDDLPEGSVVDIWSLDGGTGAFTVVGTAEVVNNELKTVSGGVVSADWHGPLGQGTVQITEEDPEICDACQKLKAITGSETSLGQGSLSVRHDLIPYRSVGQWRAPSLIYNSANADPRPVIGSKALLPTPRPQRLAVSVSYQGVAGSSEVVYDTSSMSPFDQVQLAGQFDGSALPSGIYDYALDITNVFAFSSVVTRQPGRTIINNQSSSPIGSGWGVAGLSRLIEQADQSVLMVGGGGTARIYTPLLEGTGKFTGPNLETVNNWSKGRPLAADLNADTWPDFIVPSSGTANQLDIFLNDGTGNFNHSAFATNAHPNSFVLADFNENTILDLIVLGHNSAWFYPGDGSGGFGAQTEIGTNVSGGDSIVAADFDKDNNLDIAYMNGRVDSQSISIQLGDGLGGFSAQTNIRTARGRALDIITADFDNDTNPDIAVVADPNTTGWIAVFLGDGAGGFDAPIELQAGGRPSKLATDDLNKDNNADILVSLGSGVSVIYGNGDGTFAAAEVTPLPGASACVASGNFDGNGNPDFVAGTNGTQKVAVLFDGNGMGGFPVRRRLDTGFDPACVMTADFNKDTLDDLMVIHGTSGGAHTLSIHLSDGPNNLPDIITVPAFTPNVSGTEGMVLADFDEDGVLDAAVSKRNILELHLGNGEDFSFPTSQFIYQDNGENDIQAVDFNADGHIDLAFFTSSYSNSHGVEVRLGDGLGGFIESVITRFPGNAVIQTKTKLTAGDINQDGLPDLVFRSGSVTRKFEVMLGDGTGSFSMLDSLDYGPLSREIVIADVSGDSQNEIVSYNSGTSIVVFEYDGVGAISSIGATPTGPSAWTFDVGDVNGDGIADALTGAGASNASGKSITVAIGDGTGAFVPGATVAVCPNNADAKSTLGSLTLVDIDNDGDLDAAFTCAHNRSLSTALNDGNGIFTAQRQLISHGFNNQLRAGDFNLDGAVDLVAVSDAGLDVYHNITTNNRLGLRSSRGDFSVLRPNLNGTYTRRGKAGEVTEFDVDGLQTSVADRNGNTTAYQYDGLDRLTKIIGPASKDTTFTYSGNYLSTITDPAGRVTVLVHDGDGNLTSVTDPDLSVRGFAYDARHRMIEQTSKRGFDTRYDYDGYGANWRTIRPDDSVVLVKPYAMAALPEPESDTGTNLNPLPAILVDDVFAELIDARGGVSRHTTNRFEASTVVTDSLGRSTSMVRNGANRVVQSTSPDGVMSVFSYDSHGNLKTVAEAQGSPETRKSTYTYETAFNQLVTMNDPSGKVTSYEYDSEGNLLKIIDPLLGERLYTYLSSGQTDTATDRNFNMSSYTYDAAGNVSTFTDAEGQVSRMTYDARGNIASIDVAFGTVDVITSTFSYDEMNRLLSFSDPSGVTLAFTYDTEGNMETRTYGLGETDSFVYDPLNRVTEATSSVQGKTTFNYDAEGNVISQTDARGALTTFEYDAAGQLISGVSADGGEEFYEYDPAGRVSSFTDANGQQTSFTFDALGRVVMVDSPATDVTTLVWDSRDQLLSVTDSEGVEISYDHNELMRLISLTTPDEVLNYAYDASGNLTSASDTDSDLQYDYDSLNRVVEARTEIGGLQPVTSLVYQYDSLGNRTQITDPAAGNSMFMHDDAGRMTQLTTTTGEKIDFTHDAVGRLSTVDRPNMVKTDRTYDANGHLESIEHVLNGSSLIDFTGLTRDVTGDVMSRENPDGLSTYSYDDVGRLLSADGATTEVYTYDAEGNRLASHQLTNQVYGSGNRLVSNDQFSYSYDNLGRLTSRTNVDTQLADFFVYDAFGRLTEFTDQNGLVTNYSYDVLGRRIEKNVDGDITRFIYDGANIRNQYDDQGTLLSVAEYRDGFDHPVSLLSGGQRYYMNTDQLGSITSVTNASGTLVNDYVYDAFGNLLGGSESVSIPWSFTGREFDAESGLYYYRNRYYDPVAGRFITPDPMGLAAGDSNLYAYVKNDPLNHRDPLGLFDMSDFSDLVDLANSATGLLPGVGGLVSDLFGLVKGSITSENNSAEANGTLLQFAGSRVSNLRQPLTGFGTRATAAEAVAGAPLALATFIGIAGKINLEQIGEVELALGELGNANAAVEGQLIRLRGTLKRNALSRSQLIRQQIIYFLCQVDQSDKRAVQRVIDKNSWLEQKDKEDRAEMRFRLLELMDRIAEDPASAPYEVSDIVPGVGRYDPMPR